ncbi:MAG TPA: NAD(P)H-dependent glycerol-3-phosphate dehydrogenase [Dongiaceae bacterium]|nr:NAD(P)H-dependent glycerol-3-phosphate dehydrogenase [Dongiaceae bacterium]
MRIRSLGIVGAGAWGTALALQAARAGLRPTLCARRAEAAAAIAASRENPDYLPGAALPPEVAVTAHLPDALAADAVLYAQPAQHLRAFCTAARGAWRAGAPLVVCAKGIEIGSGRLPTEVAAEVLAEAPVAVLSGPSFAGEVAAGLPTAVVIASPDAALNEALMRALSHGAFRPYGSLDPVGVELAGAAKNVLAIACGIVMGRGLGENARAALVTRGLAELARLSEARGGKAETMLGLAGVGDVVLTCNSMKSRNTSLGFELGRGRTLAEILKERRSIAEGVPTAGALEALAVRLQVDMPICGTVAAILSGRAKIDQAIRALLARPLKHEA